MDNTMKNILMFACGAGVGYLIAYKIVKEEYEELLESEIASLRDVSERKISELEEQVDDQKILVMDKYRYRKIAKNYNTISIEDVNTKLEEDKEEKTDEPEEEESEEEPEQEEDKQYKRKSPYIISLEEFSEDSNNFDKETLYYYADDDTLTTEGEEVVSDISSIIGEDALTSFGELSEGEDVVYVRNEKLGMDYEIIRLNKSYQRDVLGIEPKQKRSYKRRRAANEQ